MIDSHCHINLDQFEDDREDALHRALGDGVAGMVNIGFDRPTIDQTMELVERYPFIYAAVGVHPHDASEIDDALVADIERHLDHPRVLAVGEIGLDFYRDHSPREEQRGVFRRMLGVARERRLPIVIHCRDAFDEVIEVLTAEGGEHHGIFHAFAGTPEEAAKVLDLGLHIGVGGVVTFRNSQLSKTVRDLPLDRIVLETDSPYLTPHPYRGRRNEPSYVGHVARAVAAARKESLLELAHATTENLFTALGISPDRRPSGIYRLEDTIYIQTSTAASGLAGLAALEGQVDEMEEAVICGFTDPLEDLDRAMTAARWAAEKGLRVRVNTSGLGNVTAGRDITRELSEFVDEVVVVFYGTTPGQHERMAHAGIDGEAFDAMKDFVRRSAEAGMDAVCEFVAAPKFKADPCREFAKSLGAQYDIRMYRS